jgi:putative spermidine/putrescine transport system substrate-binding protein
VSTLTRHRFLAGAATAAAALATRPDWAFAAPAKFDGTIRVIGLGYDMLDPIIKRAEHDLGFGIVSTAGQPPDTQRLVRQQPGAFDILSCYQEDVAEQWVTGNLQPIEIAKIKRWQQITPLYKLGKVQPRNPRCSRGQGEAAFRRLYVDPDRSGRWPSAPKTPPSVKGLIVQWADETTGKPIGPEPRFSTGVPGTFNLDSFAYNAKVLSKQPEELSWAELFNLRWRGRVALVALPEVGVQDAANAAQAAGLMRFRDLGDPTRGEIDRFAKIMLLLKKKNLFFGVWGRDFSKPVEWMRAGEVVVSSMFGEQISSLKVLGVPVRQAAPREGYRAFGGLLIISREVTDPARLAACYEFLNWCQSGYAGAVLLREGGLYSAVQATSRHFMSPGEYAYWIEGGAAERNYRGPSGDVSIRKGSRRDGGSFIAQACRISSWNSTPRQEHYLLERWQEFLAGF